MMDYEIFTQREARIAVERNEPNGFVARPRRARRVQPVMDRTEAQYVGRDGRLTTTPDVYDR